MWFINNVKCSQSKTVISYPGTRIYIMVVSPRIKNLACAVMYWRRKACETHTPVGQSPSLIVSCSHVKVVVCFLLLIAGCSRRSEANGSGPDSNSVVSSVEVPADGNGPTVLLGYSKEEFQKNPISSFMYFVPLISPTPVARNTSAGNEQQVGIISYKRKITSKSFSVACEFEILGKGFHSNVFDPAGMIAEHIGELKKGETMKQTLDYIKFEGEGFGLVEVKGKMSGSTPSVTQVNLKFNARGGESPVCVGLYDVKPEDGQYKYENRSNLIVARVNEITFKKTDKTPRMGMVIASIGKTEDSRGFFNSLKAAIANLFISPTKVDKLGNDTMLNFGRALFRRDATFTFPKARNIQEDKRIETSKSSDKL